MINFTPRFENRPITEQPVHIIYRLKGSIPKAKIRNLALQYQARLERLREKFKKGAGQLLEAEYQLRERYQQRYDDLLHQCRTGPMFLSDQRAKRIIIDSWRDLERMEQLVVYAVTVMSNHVHVLLANGRAEAPVDFRELMARHKRFTGRRINQIQGQQGRDVWAHKAFDRDVRRNKFGVVLNYVINNGVVVGLTDDPLNWTGTYVQPALML